MKNEYLNELIINEYITLPGVGKLMKLCIYTLTKVAIKNWQSNLNIFVLVVMHSNTLLIIAKLEYIF